MPISGEILQDLVGQLIDMSRGDRYVPREPEPVEEERYTTAWVIRLPRPLRLGKAPECMPTSTPLWRRLGRQLVPRRTSQDCCRYHGGDWHRVSKTAIRFLHQAQRAGIATKVDTYFYVKDRAEAEGITGWDLDALTYLFRDPIRVDRAGRYYGEGQHRSQAMMDSGVRRTVVVLI